MFQIDGIVATFCLQLWGGSEKTTKHRRNTKRPDESLTTSNTAETEGLNEQAEKVEKPEDAADVIKQYEEIIRTKNKGIISIAHHQGNVFKSFWEKEKFIQMVGKLKIHTSTIIFKINIFKLIDQHLKLMKSSVTLSFLKNYFKDIMQICEENSSKFEQVKVIRLIKLF